MAPARTPYPPPNRQAWTSSGNSWCTPARSCQPSASGVASSYASNTRGRWGSPNRASIARSVSRWPPCAAGSITQTRCSVPHRTLPFQRSPCSRAGGSSGTRSASRATTPSTRWASSSPIRPRSRASLRYGSTRRCPKNSAQVGADLLRSGRRAMKPSASPPNAVAPAWWVAARARPKPDAASADGRPGSTQRRIRQPSSAASTVGNRRRPPPPRARPGQRTRWRRTAAARC